MPWREAFLTRFGPGCFGGITLGQWLRVLRENGFSVDPPYWARAAMITHGALSNTPMALWEDWNHGKQIREAEVKPPLIVLGIFRSGTTLLHNLLTRDTRFAFPNTYQTCFPRTFLSSESLQAKFINWFMPATRPQDNVAMGVEEPQEDEFALMSLTGRSFNLIWVFPRNADHYRRFLTLRNVSASEAQEWEDAISGFVKKLSFKYGKPLVLKSPGHTCRIARLLKLFPDARFVHIHRDPFEVFSSLRHVTLKVTPWFTLQRPSYDGLDDHVIGLYKEVFDAYFEEVGLIPSGSFHEVGFKELEADPVGVTKRIYESLDLPEFSTVEPEIRRYVNTLSGYKKNDFAEIPPALKARIAREWGPYFEKWGYAV